MIVQVKSGHVNVAQIRDFKGVMEREKAAIGALLTLKPPTRPMREEAAAAGFYEPENFPEQRFPRLQILTVGRPLRRQKTGLSPLVVRRDLQKGGPPTQRPQRRRAPAGPGGRRPGLIPQVAQASSLCCTGKMPVPPLLTAYGSLLTGANMLEIKAIGIGGIGCALLPFLCRYLQLRRGAGPPHPHRRRPL